MFDLILDELAKQFIILMIICAIGFGAIGFVIAKVFFC